jgi:glycosyltransferase involved in cell wall biosynthesis
MLNGGDPGTSIGGRTMNVVELSRGLQRRGWAVQLEDVRRRLPLRLPPNCDILHAHGYQGNYVASLLRVSRAAWRSVPLVTTLHGWLWHSPKYAVMNLLELRSIRASHAVAVQSRAMKRRLDAKGIRNVHIVPTGITPPAEEITMQWHPPGFRVVYIGRVAPEKRLDISIKGVAFARDSIENIHLDIIGPLADGRLVTELVELSRNLQINDRVHWWGQQSRPWSLLRPDVVILTSDTEGLPRVLIEAAHRGIPVIATSVGGVPDIIREGVTGMLIAAGDHIGLGHNLVALARDPDRLRSMSIEAREQALQFTLETMLDRYESLYCGVLGHR